MEINISDYDIMEFVEKKEASIEDCTENVLAVSYDEGDGNVINKVDEGVSSLISLSSELSNKVNVTTKNLATIEDTMVETDQEVIKS